MVSISKAFTSFVWQSGKMIINWARAVKYKQDARKLILSFIFSFLLVIIRIRALKLISALGGRYWYERQKWQATTSKCLNLKSNQVQSMTYNAEKIIGNGSFGVVFKATIAETGETVAIKKVF